MVPKHISAALKQQVGGNHYKKLAIQPVEFILHNALGFCEGNVIKLVTRWKDKGGIQDLQKAQHYLSILIEHETGRIGRPESNYAKNEQLL